MSPSEVDALVDRLLESYESGPRAMHHLGGYELPQMSEVVKCTDEIRALLFPGFVGDPLVGATREQIHAHVKVRAIEVGRLLRHQVYRGLHHRCQLMRGSREHDCARIGSTGSSFHRPWRGSPSSAAKQAPESNRGRQSQSIEPSRPTRAAVCRSPIRPYSSIRSAIYASPYLVVRAELTRYVLNQSRSGAPGPFSGGPAPDTVRWKRRAQAQDAADPWGA